MIGALYAKPRTLEDATSLLASLGPGGSIIAGGQELMPTINYHVFAPTVLVDINGLKELKGVAIEDSVLSIGALCVHREIAQNDLVREYAPLLAHAVAQIGGGWQVRNRGTLGGNIVSMHPLYDTLPALLALDASVEIAKDGGIERVALANIIAQSNHGLGTDSILTRVLIPSSPINTGWGYDKLKNTHGAYASATAAALISLDAQRRVTDIRVTVGSVEPMPRNLHGPLSNLRGTIADKNLLDRVEITARDAVLEAISDQRGHAEYRTAMAGVSARRAVEKAIATFTEIMRTGV